MNKILIGLMAICSYSMVEAQVFWTEDFETDGSGTRYFAGTGDEFVDGVNDHYGRTDGSNTSGSYGGQSASFYWAGEDLDDAGTGNGLNPKTLTFASQNITGMSAVQLSGLFAQGSSGITGLDVSDFMDVEYRVDGGAWTDALYFAGIDNGDNTNNGAAFDSDMDGTGDFPLLSPTFASFSATFPVSGSAIEVRIIMSANSGNEEYAYDLIQLSDASTASTCSIDLIADGGNQSACDPANNTFSNDVTISYTDAPTSGTLDINGQSFAIGTSPQTVTLTGLIADGSDIDVSASFSADASCTAIETSLFSSPSSCLVLPDLVITEIMYNTASTDDEWIEICNNNGADVDISNYQILDDGSPSFTFPAGSMITDGACITVSLGSNGDGVYNNNCPFTPDYGVDASTNATNVLSNGSGTISLITGSNVVDVVAYSDADGADGNGNSLHVTDITMSNDATGVNWEEVLTGGSPGLNSLVSNCAPTNTLVEFTSVSSTVVEGVTTVDVCVGITNQSMFDDMEVVVNISSSSTATNGTDYNDGMGNAYPVQSLAYFFAGDNTDQCFTFSIAEDLDVEGNESIILFLSDAFGGNMGALGSNTQHVITIEDNDIPAAMPCEELFISEYVEGSSNNKCVEIYNPSSALIDMTAQGYALYKYNNGSSTPTDTLFLNGVLSPGEVHVVCAVGAGTVFTAAADVITSFPSVVHHNGDDAIQLVKGASTSAFGVSVDVIGVIGVDPGAAWSDAGGTCSTADMTLVRKSSIQLGDANGTDAFDPTVEWDCYPTDTDTEIGGHISNCIVSTCSIVSIADGGNQSSCDPATNSYSNDVIITYSDAPAFGSLDVNGQSFPIASSPQTVTLTDLIADGQPVSISAVFSSDAACTLSATDVFTAPVNCLPANTLLINEFDYDQSGTDTGEFLELYNAGSTALDLDPYSVVLVNGNGNSIYATIDLPSVILAAGDYYVICFGPNTSSYCDQQESGIAPQNGPDAVGLLFAGNLVEALSYEADVSGYVEGSASVADGESNGLSRIPNGTDTQDNSADFQSVCLSPGEANLICPANDQCSGAFTAPVVEFGGSANYMMSTSANATANPVCAGVGDEVVWFRFVAQHENDVIQAGVHPSLSSSFPTGYDAVIEVWDGCAGLSLGCFDNYPADQLERAMVGGLIPGNTYYYSVHTAGGSGSATSDEFFTIVKTFHSTSLRSPWCGATDVTLDDVIQSERDDVNEMYQFVGVQVPAYGFEFSQSGTVITSIDNMAVDGFYQHLGQVDGLAYEQTYDVRVRHQVRLHVNGAIGQHWSDYGPVCTISTGAVPTTQVNASWCMGNPDYFLSENILADPLTGATAYRFTFDDGVSPVVYDSDNYSVQLYSVGGLEYGTTYSVTVQALLSSGYTMPGTACVINMSVKPENTGLQMASCNGSFTWPSSDFLLSENILGAEYWEFRFTPLGGGAPVSAISPDLSLTLNSQVQGLMAGMTYDVDVRVFAGNTWGDFSATCPVTILPAPVAMPLDDVTAKSRMDVSPTLQVYPNPNTGQEMVIEMEEVRDYTQFDIRVIDITGKTVHAEHFVSKASAVYRLLTFESRLESGLYLVHVTHGSTTSVEKVLVK